MNDRGLSPHTVARRLDLSKSNVYRQIKAGEIPARKIGGRYVVPESWVDDLLADAVTEWNQAS